MKNLIREGLEPTVEKKLIKALKKMKDFNWKKGYPVVCWNFNSQSGSSPLYQNSPIKTKRTTILSKEKKAQKHAERNCINALSEETKQNGQNTLFVTLIPCLECLKYLYKLPEEYHVIYFVDHLNKIERESYKKWNKRVPMVKYESTDKRINKVINRIEKVYVDREVSLNGPIESNNWSKKQE